ncbi:MAG: endopeptidase La [Ruminococcaceae bacterium]|nr:endopeptidase La [Oscillospiraceae bacterium]
MSENSLNNNIEINLPLIPLRGIVGFPAVQLSIEIARPTSLKAFTAAATLNNAKILLVAQKDIAVEEPEEKDLYKIGILAEIKHVVKNPQGTLSVIFEGISRIKINGVSNTSGYLTAFATIKKEQNVKTLSQALEALMHEVKMRLSQIKDIHPTFSEDMRLAAEAISDPGYLADFVASSAIIDYKNKQTVLETSIPKSRLEKLLVALEEEAMLLECEHSIQMQVREKIDRNQKDYFLREQIKAIQSELGDDDDDEIKEYEDKIEAAVLPDEVKEKLYKELGKLSKTPFGAAEGTVLRTYLDTCLDFPFGKKSTEPVTVEEARVILDADHDGLKKVKERILEFVAVKQFSPELKSQIICLIGPPGVGKTSVAASVARALKRKYARVSLGGMHDEAEIRGHRKTYVGAMPGRIVTALINSKVENPVIVLDEIDKMAKDFRGDPTSALLEVLDPEQNKSFRDNFMEIPIDLSDALFIATANSYEGIPSPLLDRMEIIELSTYTDSEKLAIAKNHLVPKQLRRNGITKKMFRITDGAILELIKSYTKEAGVRNLEREIASLIRKSAKKIAEEEIKSVTVTEKNISSFLGKAKVIPERLENENPIGVVNGLAYTQAGGDLLKVEVAAMEGTGKIELTGSLGDVMKESAKIAHSLVRTIYKDYGINPDFYKNSDLHIHFPEGAVPKDGPSAGVTMVTAIVSALGKIPVRRDVAMTGEITLRGNVLAIGGLREKTLAAYRAGIKTMILPEDNMRDLDEIDSEARANLEFIPCKTATEVLSSALARD